MNVSMHGKAISKIFFASGESITSCPEKILWLSATYHGDRDEFWVIEQSCGTEIARHNPKYLETIQWQEEEND